MSEADDLARRFFALWTEYLTALLADPKTAEPLRRWINLASSPPGPASGDDGGSAAARSPTGAAAAAAASGQREPVVAELARRVEELAERVAALEKPGKRNGRAADGPRRRGRAARP